MKVAIALAELGRGKRSRRREIGRAKSARKRQDYRKLAPAQNEFLPLD